MFDLTTATQAVERDFGATLARLDALTEADWDLPVRCAGWTVRDLGRHLVAAGRGQAEGLNRAGIEPGTPAALAIPEMAGRAEILVALRDAFERVNGALAALTPDSLAGFVPLPFGVLPTPVALQIVALEYGFHRNDLEWALGETAPLSEDIAATLLDVVPGLLPMLAAGSPVSASGAAPQRPTSFVLTAPGHTWVLSYDQGWSVAPGGTDTAGCRISGDTSSLALFVMGRVPADDDRIKTDDPGAAAAFKSYFPGP
jgi:uncharacterized protein (TIGR03083 family)